MSTKSSTEATGAAVAQEPSHVRRQDTRNTLELMDEAALVACGYKQEFKREFSFFSTFSVSFSILGVLPSIASTLSYATGTVGYAGLSWGWLIACTGIMSVALCMAELSSSMPTSGGLYYCAAILAPPGYGPVAAYMVGWSNWLSLVVSAPSFNYGIVSLMFGLISIDNPDFDGSNAKLFGISLALTFVCSVMAAFPTKWIAWVNSIGTYLQIAALFIVMWGVPAAVRNTPKFNSNAIVWSSKLNFTDWPFGFAVLQSFLIAIWTMSGYDAPFHLSEECSNSQIATPRAIVTTAVTGTFLSWGLTLVIAYTLVDIPALDDAYSPFIGWLQQTVNNDTVIAFGSLTIVCGFLAAQGSAVSASRLAFAYARDGVLPWGKKVSQVSKLTYTPVNAVIFNFLVQAASLCLIFAGDIAIGAIFSIGAIGAYAAFIVPIGIRCFCPGDRWRPGPWHLGPLSKPLGYFSCAYVALMIPILCFPTVKGADLDPSSMNWSCVVWGGPLFLAAVFFAIHARKTFKGPVINVDHLNLPDGRELSQKELHELKIADVGAVVRQAED